MVVITKLKGFNVKARQKDLKKKEQAAQARKNHVLTKPPKCVAQCELDRRAERYDDWHPKEKETDDGKNKHLKDFGISM